jgi:hypothetical protein
VPKFTSGERRNIEGIVGSLSIKRIPDLEIIKEVFKQTNHNITRQTLYNVRQRIKKEFFKWFKTLRESQFEYIHEFRERVRGNRIFAEEALRDNRWKSKQPFYSTSSTGSSS